jgi:hypothetical protein
MYVDFMQAPTEEDLRGEGEDVRHPPHELQGGVKTNSYHIMT